MLDIDLDVRWLPEFSNDARRSAAADLHFVELVQLGVAGPRKLAQAVIGLVQVEGDRLARFLLGESEVEDDEPVSFNLALEPPFNQLAQSGVGLDANNPRAFQQVIFDVVAVVHSKVVNQSVRHRTLVTTA